MARTVETRFGVELTNLDQTLFDGAGATKRDLVDYLEVMADRMLPGLSGRPLSVVRIRPGQPPFMQKNLPPTAPAWIPRLPVWSSASHREIAYAVADDPRTLLWFGNQRAVEYHVTVLTAPENTVSWVVLDLDPPESDGRERWGRDGTVVRTARLVQQALADAGLVGAVKTSGSKGLHILVPVAPDTTVDDAAAATRALGARAAALDPELATVAYIKDDRGGRVFVDSTRSGGATLVATYSPRARPGVPVSFPVGWDGLDDVVPDELTVRTVPGLLGAHDPWSATLPARQRLPQALVAEGHTIPVARVQAMHEGKRRKRAAAQRAAEADPAEAQDLGEAQNPREALDPAAT
ncbi:DNA polymerase domain-containing protein [Nakamurella deserti]|uniref:DNA polymerase domain-containing protein n=1 Tax=Nakamurella deserti TaxID=2164074 RepID=UPI00197B7A8F|nr:ATP-dependent DNA ligase [Nakamurella deserti]